ncbi:MAG: ferredoxin family protein [Gemmatales bacterium]|nr:ferredoxin family protein [Gemmatales bacterium]MDW7993186.1 ferredoxin family protein [Gemmatales bacterium]
MSRFRLTVVLSQAQGKHPERRALEEAIVTGLLGDPRFEVSVIPHVYDLEADHPARLFLTSVRGDLVVLAWLYPRATFWVLDRDGVRGHWGQTRLRSADENHAEHSATEDKTASENNGAQEGQNGRAAQMRPPPPERFIYCLDLRTADNAEPFLAEIHRIYEEAAARAAKRAQAEAPLLELGLRRHLPADRAGIESDAASKRFTPDELLRPPARRWYPVIDYSRCTNCLECLNFCLFGVYSVTADGLIYVNQQDECRKGCPACSRVCPEHAIMFPEYKSPAIAGASFGGIESLKVDLTKLFGGADALRIAAAERDRELIAAGRQAVGMTVGIPKRQAHKPNAPKDDLDQLLDQLDAADL